MKLFSALESLPTTSNYSESQVQARLAMESELVSNVLTIFRELIPSVRARVSEVLQNFSDSSPFDIVAFEKGSQQIENRNFRNSFANFTKVLIVVPEGLKGDFKSYGTYLLESAPRYNRLINELLGEYRLVVSSFISNHNSRISLEDHSRLYAKIRVGNALIANERKAFFDNTSRTKAYLGNVIHQASDINEVGDVLRGLVKTVRVSQLKEIRNAVTDISGLLDILIENSKTEDVTNVSGKAARNIADGAFLMAQLVESISLFHFQVETYVSCCTQMVETIKKLKY